MRIALISDQHFDVNSRWSEHLRIMQWIVDDLAGLRPDVICLGGDLFERRPVSEEVDAASAWLVQLADIAPVVGVYGNHDVPHALEVMNRLEAKHPITFYATPKVHYMRDLGLAIACLPWPRRAHVVAALGRQASSEELNAVSVDALRDVLRGLDGIIEAHQDLEGTTPIFLGHVQVRGARVSTGQPLAPGADFELGLEDLGLCRARAYLLGHIHRGNVGEWEWNGAPVVYPGSPRRTSFGEFEDKGYAWLDVNADEPDVSVRFVVAPATPMVHLNATFRDGRLHVEEPGSMSPPNDVRGAEIRLRYSVTSDQRDAARAAADKWRGEAIAAGAVSVRVEEVVATTVRARAPEIAEARSTADKLDAYWNARKLVPEAERRERLRSQLSQIETA